MLVTRPTDRCALPAAHRIEKPRRGSQRIVIPVKSPENMMRGDMIERDQQRRLADRLSMRKRRYMVQTVHIWITLPLAS
jgi:hypothetical protein